MFFDTIASPSWDPNSFQHQQDKLKQSASGASRWQAPTEDFFDNFVNTDSFHGRNEGDESDFPLDHPNFTDMLPSSDRNDVLEDTYLSSIHTSLDAAQNSWHDSALGNDPALLSFDDAFSANYAPSDSFLSSAEDPLLSFDHFHSQPDLDLVALPSSPAAAPLWTSKTNHLKELDFSITESRQRESTSIEHSDYKALSGYPKSLPTRGRKSSRQHEMPARRWEDSTFENQMRRTSLSGQQELTSPSQPYYSSRENGEVPTSNKFYFSHPYQLEADSAPLYRDTSIPEDPSYSFRAKRPQLHNSPTGSPTLNTGIESRNSSFNDAQPGLTFSSYPSTPRSHADDPCYPMTPPQIQPTDSRTWKHDEADALQDGKAEGWWNLPTDQSEASSTAPTTPRTLGLGISNMHSASQSGRIAYPSDRQFSPDSMTPTSSHSRHFSYGSGASASFDQLYAVPQAQMMPIQQQQRVQNQSFGSNQMIYHPASVTISPAQMSSQSFNSPVPLPALPYLNNTPGASSLAPSTRASSIAFSRASSHRSSPSPSPIPQTRASERRERKQNRRSTSRATNNSSRNTSCPAAAAEVGDFINFTPSDKKRILTGVAPSGSSKTKARREKEAAEQKRKMSEAARRAVLSGDMGLLERSGVFGT
jgi:hypothetical protein